MGSLPPEDDLDDAGGFDGVHNLNTVCPPGVDMTSALTYSIEQQRGAIEAGFEDLGRGQPTDLVAHIALVSPGSLSLYGLSDSPDDYIVVGRHTEADMRAPEDLTLSLRHVLLIPAAARNAECSLDVVGLLPTVEASAWAQPLPDALRHCTALRLGNSLLLIAPATQREHLTDIRLAPAPVSGLVGRVPPNKAVRNNASQTRITWATPLDDLVPSEAFADAAPGGLDDAGLALELSDGERRVRVRLRESWLEQGIVLGRHSHKCSHASLARILSSDHGISRCHLYLRREQDKIVFYDTGSASGVHLVEGPDGEPEYVRRWAVARPGPSTATPPVFLVPSVHVRLLAVPTEALR